MNSKVKQFERADQRYSAAVIASNISDLKCPGCHKQRIEITKRGQQKVNPEFMARHRAGESTDGISKYIEGDPMVTCSTPNCPLHDYTLDLKSLLTMIETNNLGQYAKTFSRVKNNGSPPLFKLDFPSIISKDKCPSCGSTLYKFDDKSLKQESENSFRECKNKSCRLYKVILPLGRMSDISDLEIHNFRNRQDRQDELAKGKSPFEAYDATSDKSIPDGDRLDKLRDYRYSKVKTVVKRQFIKTGR